MILLYNLNLISSTAASRATGRRESSSPLTVVRALQKAPSSLARKMLSAFCVALLLCSVTVAQSATTPDAPLVLNENGLAGTPKDDVTPEELLKMMKGDAFELTNPTHVNGEELFESDILLTPQQRQLLAERKAVSDPNYFWPPNDVGDINVPFVFSDELVDRDAVRVGLNHWEQNTCIKFVETTNTSQPHLKFKQGSGCWSYVGRIYFWNGQDISIGNGCTGMGIVVHEVGHAMGFHHEQSRSDRDSYVHVNLDNIQSGREGNFGVANDNNYSVPYDYSSDMHYGATYFSVNGRLTLATINPLAQELVGSRAGLSHYDKLLANTMYPCIEKWLNDCSMTSDPCLNDGYTGADCHCVCPSGTSGRNCETVDADYYDSLLSGCSEIVTEEGTITSPNYPNNYPSGLKCVKWIQAPECHTVQLTVNSFQLYGKNPYCGNALCCYFDKLEIRTSNLYDGDMYCGDDISPGDTFTSSDDEMILYFATVSNYYPGWTADVAFIPSDSCPSTNTTTTTTAPADCEIKTLSKGRLSWKTPLFGEENYENDAFCTLSPSSPTPKWAIFQFKKFQLESGCYDYLNLSLPYDLGTMQFCDSKKETIRLPSFNFNSIFSSDSSNTDIGFNILVIPKTSRCHKLIMTEVGGTGIIKTPRKNKKTWLTKACEWWIESPRGTQISLEFIQMELDNDCEQSAVLLNGNGDPTYPTASSQQYCESGTQATVLSEGNKMNVMFYSTENDRHFKARWSVVAYFI